MMLGSAPFSKDRIWLYWPRHDLELTQHCAVEVEWESLVVEARQVLIEILRRSGALSSPCDYLRLHLIIG